jgi:two-component system response regulator NreC
MLTVLFPDESQAAHDYRAGMGSDPHVVRPPADVAGPDGSPIRVVLAAEHPSMRRSLRWLLDGEPGLEVIAEALDVSTVIGYVHSQAPEVLVLDLRMANGSRIDAVRYLRSHAPGTAVVLLSMDASPALAQQAMDAGAMGFVLNDQADTELAAAVRKAARR